MRTVIIILYLIHSVITEANNTTAILNSEVIRKEVFNNSFNNDEIITRIVRGRAAELGEVPYQVSFKMRVIKFYEKVALHFCGGTLVHPSKIVSAAHCFADGKECFGLGGWRTKNLRKIIAVMGSLTTNAALLSHGHKEGQWKTLRRVSIHPTYNFPVDDIAIVFTHRPFRLNDHISTINYARQFVDYSGTCVISGYGMINNRVRSDILLIGETNVLPINVCKRMMKRNKRGIICTEVYPSDTAKGDSGGPLVCSNTGEKETHKYGNLVGIVSGGVYERYSFFTRVSEYAKFIANAVEAPKISIEYFSILVLYGLLF